MAFYGMTCLLVAVESNFSYFSSIDPGKILSLNQWMFFKTADFSSSSSSSSVTRNGKKLAVERPKY